MESDVGFNETVQAAEGMMPPLLERAVEGGVLIVICILAMGGNLVLWTVVLRTPELHSSSNYLLLCLSAADLLVAAVNMPLTVNTLFEGRWVLSDEICVTTGFTNMFSFVASVMSLCMIALNRYVRVCQPQHYVTMYSPRAVLLHVTGVWVLSALLSAPPILGWGEYGYEEKHFFCFCRWEASLSYSIFMVVFCFGGTSSLMTVCYVAIYRKFVRSKRLLASSNGGISSCCGGGTDYSSSSSNARDRLSSSVGDPAAAKPDRGESGVYGSVRNGPNLRDTLMRCYARDSAIAGCARDWNTQGDGGGGGGGAGGGGKDWSSESVGKDLRIESVGKDWKTESGGKDWRFEGVGKDLRVESGGNDWRIESGGMDRRTESGGKDRRTECVSKECRTDARGKVWRTESGDKDRRTLSRSLRVKCVRKSSSAFEEQYTLACKEVNSIRHRANSFAGTESLPGGRDLESFRRKTPRGKSPGNNATSCAVSNRITGLSDEGNSFGNSDRLLCIVNSFAEQPFRDGINSFVGTELAASNVSGYSFANSAFVLNGADSSEEPNRIDHKPLQRYEKSSSSSESSTSFGGESKLIPNDKSHNWDHLRNNLFLMRKKKGVNEFTITAGDGGGGGRSTDANFVPLRLFDSATKKVNSTQEHFKASSHRKYDRKRKYPTMADNTAYSDAEGDTVSGGNVKHFSALPYRASGEGSRDCNETHKQEKWRKSACTKKVQNAELCCQHPVEEPTGRVQTAEHLVDTAVRRDRPENTAEANSWIKIYNARAGRLPQSQSSRRHSDALSESANSRTEIAPREGGLSVLHRRSGKDHGHSGRGALSVGQSVVVYRVPRNGRGSRFIRSNIRRMFKTSPDSYGGNIPSSQANGIVLRSFRSFKPGHCARHGRVFTASTLGNGQPPSHESDGDDPIIADGQLRPLGAAYTVRGRNAFSELNGCARFCSSGVFASERRKPPGCTNNGEAEKASFERRGYVNCARTDELSKTFLEERWCLNDRGSLEPPRKTWSERRRSRHRAERTETSFAKLCCDVSTMNTTPADSVSTSLRQPFVSLSKQSSAIGSPVADAQVSIFAAEHRVGIPVLTPPGTVSSTDPAVTSMADSSDSELMADSSAFVSFGDAAGDISVAKSSVSVSVSNLTNAALFPGPSVSAAPVGPFSASLGSLSASTSLASPVKVSPSISASFASTVNTSLASLSVSISLLEPSAPSGPGYAAGASCSSLLSDLPTATDKKLIKLPVSVSLASPSPANTFESEPAVARAFATQSSLPARQITSSRSISSSSSSDIRRVGNFTRMDAFPSQRGVSVNNNISNSNAGELSPSSSQQNPRQQSAAESGEVTGPSKDASSKFPGLEISLGSRRKTSDLKTSSASASVEEQSASASRQGSFLRSLPATVTSGAVPSGRAPLPGTSPQPVAKNVSSCSLLLLPRVGTNTSLASGLRDHRRKREEMRLTSTMLLVILAYVVSWLPYCAMILINAFTSNGVPRRLDMLALLMGYGNSLVNPFIYGLRNVNIRRGYLKLWSDCRNPAAVASVCKAKRGGRDAGRTNPKVIFEV